MAIDAKYQNDADIIMSHINDNGADYWTTPDRRLLKGSPFSAYMSALLLLELGTEPSDPVLKGVADLFFAAWRESGEFKLYPSGGIFPCQTAQAAELLCKMGYAGDERLQTTFKHLLDTRHTDGGWRCKKFFFGRGPETECSNPYPTLVVLDAFRFTGRHNDEPALEGAIEFLLQHWVIKKPIGPCHYGIGSLFMQVEYPFYNYNLFLYVYVLSFYKRARTDSRFLEAFGALSSKLQDGQVVVERVVPKLAKLNFCRKGQPGELATNRYKEILINLES